MTDLDKVYCKMIDFYSGNPAYIQHFVKVHSFAALIGRLEGLDKETLETLEAAAYVHDIGIKPALIKYGSGDGKYQEELGPDEAKILLKECCIDGRRIDRIAYLVGHHHTYDAIDGMDYQILVEADFLVNLHEGGNSKDSVRRVYETIFRTAAGKQILAAMFGI